MSSTAFLFPGQGSQYVGMGKAACDRYEAARETFEAADEILGFGLSSLCFNGPEDVLTDTINAQPAILVTSIAYLRIYESPDPPAFVAGHSLGEYTALVAAKALSYEEGVTLVRERGRLMKEAGSLNPGSMAAIIGMDVEPLEALCRDASGSDEMDSVRIANYNAPGQLVISGSSAAVERAMQMAQAAGARRVIPLAVSIASHSPLMRVVVTDLRKAVLAAKIEEVRLPVIANTTAKAITSSESLEAELVDQLTSSVRWIASMEHMLQQGVGSFVEVGPKNVLSGLMRRISKDAQMINAEAELGLAQ